MADLPYRQDDAMTRIKARLQPPTTCQQTGRTTCDQIRP